MKRLLLYGIPTAMASVMLVFSSSAGLAAGCLHPGQSGQSLSDDSANADRAFAANSAGFACGNNWDSRGYWNYRDMGIDSDEGLYERRGSRRR